MTLKEEFIKKGKWLFRYRSYLPLYLSVLLIIAFLDDHTIIIDTTIDKIYEIICLSVSFFGLLIRIITIGFTPKNTSGRNKKTQKAEMLNTTGIYSVVRNPLYLGNYFVLLGIMMYPQSVWLVVISSLIFWIYYERIIFMEEDFLRNKFKEHYLNWANNVPPFVPKFKEWKSAKLQFSFKNILKREYLTFFAIIIIFCFLEVLKDYFYYKKVIFDVFWVITFCFGLLTFIILRILVKKTNILKVSGR